MEWRGVAYAFGDVVDEKGADRSAIVPTRNTGVRMSLQLLPKRYESVQKHVALTKNNAEC